MYQMTCRRLGRNADDGPNKMPNSLSIMPDHSSIVIELLSLSLPLPMVFIICITLMVSATTMVTPDTGVTFYLTDTAEERLMHSRKRSILCTFAEDRTSAKSL